MVCIIYYLCFVKGQHSKHGLHSTIVYIRMIRNLELKLDKSNHPLQLHGTTEYLCVSLSIYSGFCHLSTSRDMEQITQAAFVKHCLKPQGVIKGNQT